MALLLYGLSSRKLFNASVLAFYLFSAPAEAAERSQVLDFAPPIQVTPPSNGPAATAPAQSDDLTISLGASAGPSGQIETAMFVLSGVAISGGTIFSDAELAQTYREFLGQRIGTPEISQIVSRITAKYRKAGYFLSHAVAARQPLIGGILDVRIIEGYIDKVTVDGTEDRLTGRLEAYTAALSSERPLRMATLERAILVMRDLPGITFSPSVAPIDEAAGRYELRLKADAKPLSGDFAVDNHGPAYEGPWETQANATLTSAVVPFDELSASFFTVPTEPRELVAGGLVYSVPLGSSGLRASLAAARSSIHPGDYLAFADLRGITDTYGAGLTYPLLRSRDQSLWLSGSFDVVQSREDIPVANLYDDHLRVLRADMTYFAVDPWGGNTRAYAQVSQGLGILGASPLNSPNLSTSNGHAEFTKAFASLTHERSLVGDFTIFVDLAGQKSWQPLLLTEQFSLGGARFGRGYDPAELLGDDALVGAVELRYGRVLDAELLHAFQFYVFYDLGEVWNHDPGSLVRRASLASVGSGMRLTLAQDVRLSIEIARPLTLPLAPDFNKPVRAFVRLSRSF